MPKGRMIISNTKNNITVHWERIKKCEHGFRLSRIEYGKYIYECYICGKEKKGDKRNFSRFSHS